MPIPGSGAISFAALRNEFGGGNPVYISDYFRGGPRVPNTGTNAGVPTGGILYLSNFRNASAATPFTFSMSPSYLTGSWAQSTQGTVSRGSTGSFSGGTGNYSITNAVVTSGQATVSRNGNNVTVSATGRNTSRIGTVQVTATDGVTTLTANINYEYSFGTPL
ncbi:hypothetical protein [Xanthomonas phage BUDD]|nr:hypothetical protein [Xanthomonas phage BUDD]